jgi:hypothetical protein
MAVDLTDAPPRQRRTVGCAIPTPTAGTLAVPHTFRLRNVVRNAIEVWGCRPVLELESREPLDAAHSLFAFEALEFSQARRFSEWRLLPQHLSERIDRRVTVLAVSHLRLARRGS